MAIDARVLLDQLAKDGVRPGAKLTSKTALLVAKRWLPLAGWQRDTWGNYKHPSQANRRIVLTDRSLKIQQKHGRSWTSYQTSSLIDWATDRLLRLAEKVGTAEQKQGAEQAYGRRRGNKRDALAKRNRQAAVDEARGRLNKEAMVALRDQGLLAKYARGAKHAFDLNPAIAPFQTGERLDAEIERLLAYKTEHRDWPPEDDGAYWSLGQPPYPFVRGTPDHYAWEQDGYTVTFERRPTHKPNTAEWMIGATGGVMGFDPGTFAIRQQRVDRVGDGYAAGLVRGVESGQKLPKAKQADPVVVLTMIGSHTKKKGTGRKLMALVRNMVWGYGRDDFFIEAITPEGQGFFDHLVDAGELELLGRTRTGGHYRFVAGKPMAKAQPKRRTKSKSRPQAKPQVDLLDRLLSQVEEQR